MIEIAYNFFNNIENIFPFEKIKEEFKNNQPVPHTVIDNFLPQDLYQKLIEEFKTFPAEQWTEKTLPKSGKRLESRNFKNSPVIQTVMNGFSMGTFVSWMEQITGNTQLIPDLHFVGTGLVATPSQSYLGLHIDFNWNDKLKLNRKYNLILYANETWKEEWGGSLELWDFDVTHCVKRIDPKPNRLVAWYCDERLMHGFPSPINTPADVNRQMMLVAYYNSNSSPESPPRKSIYL